MTFDKFTIKAQEAVQEAVNIAQRNGQQTIEPVHLLSGILEKATDVTNYIFQKLGINGQQIAMLLRKEMQHLPKEAALTVAGKVLVVGGKALILNVDAEIGRAHV